MATLNASERAQFGKGAARKLRGAGQLPAVIYRGGTDAVSIAIDPAELEGIFRQSGNANTLLDIKLGKKSFPCLVRDAQRHPVTLKLRHVDFYQVDEKEDVTVAVPVRTTGLAQGVAMGGVLRTVVRTLDIICRPSAIPASIEVDVTPMVVGDFVKVSEIPAPKGCTIVYGNDFNVLSCVGRRVEVEVETVEVPEEGADAEEGEEKAEA